MNTFASIGAHSCGHCNNLVLDFSDCGNENQIRLFRTINEHNAWSLGEEDSEDEDQSLSQDSDSDRYLRSDAGLSDWLSLSNILILEDTAKVLERKAREGCKLYATFLEAQKTRDEDGISYDYKTNSPIFGTRKLTDGIEFGYIGTRHKKSKDYSSASEIWPFFLTVIIKLEIGVDDGSLHLMASWLKVCMEGHPSCRSPSAELMPSYVLRISRDEQGLFLQLIQSTKALQYAALSYCWGREQVLLTTKATLASHMAQIPFQQLPQTLKDAILVTHSLGLSYLWIDALCITQDDHDFKGVEIAKMANVYGNAAVTIIASCAGSVQEGFLHRRNPREDEFFNVQYKNRPMHNPEPVYLFSSALKSKMIHTPEPLRARGWALQERLLSRRIIEFTTHQTRWFCQDEKATFADGLFQTYADWNPASRLHTAQQQLWRVQDRTSDNASSLGDITTNQRISKELLDGWYRLVSSYSVLQLSIATDKLPAFSAIAERYAMMSGDQYLAGLWRSALADGMAWNFNPFYVLTERAEIYQAPSWSWASIDAPIKYVTQDYYYPDGTDPSFQIEKCEVALATKGSKYGEVRSGILTVKGHVVEATWIVNRSQRLVNQQAIKIPGCPFEEISGHPHFHFAPDAREAEIIALDVVSVPIFLIVAWVAPSRMRGLVLRPLPNGQFSRLGLFEFHHWEIDRHKRVFQWLLDAEIRTIEII